MPTLFLIIGLPGAGKTTLAMKLERERPALRLTPDESMTPLYGEMDQAELDSRRTPVETMQWEIAAQSLRLGVDVILDWGFWSRSERDDFRSRAAALGARAELRYLDVPREVLAARLAARNANLPPGTFRVSEAQLDLFSNSFEPPTAEELAS